MIVVLCVICVFVFISFALLLSSSILVSTANLSSIDEKCRISAMTFSEALENELSAAYSTKGVENTDLRAYLRKNIADSAGTVGAGSWVYYEKNTFGHEKGDAFRTLDFDLGEADEANVGVFSAEMYWEYDSGSEGAILHVAVTCKFRGRQHTVTTQYELKREDVTLPNLSEFTEWVWKEVWRS